MIEEITVGQIGELMEQGKSRQGEKPRITRNHLQFFLSKPDETLMSARKYFTPLFRNLIPTRLLGVWLEVKKIAQSMSYDGPIAWLVKGGFNLEMAPKLGPCYYDFTILKGRVFESHSTIYSLVFWIPRVLADSNNKTASQQGVDLCEWSKYFRSHNFPIDFGFSFSRASVLAGLILSHFQLTGERVPLNGQYVRTSTRANNKTWNDPLTDYLCLGGFTNNDGLAISGWGSDGAAVANVWTWPFHLESLNPGEIDI